MYDHSMKKSPALILTGLVCILLIIAGCMSSSDATSGTTQPGTNIAPLPDAQPIATASTDTPWSGTWATTYNYGETGLFVEVFSLTQTGSLVTGTYSSGDECEFIPDTTGDETNFTGNCYGTINGTLDGNTLTGIWVDTDKTGTYTGWFTFELSENGRVFQGYWADESEGFEALKNTTQFWNGVKV